jgi:hypothetical protein
MLTDWKQKVFSPSREKEEISINFCKTSLGPFNGTAAHD